MLQGEANGPQLIGINVAGQASAPRAAAGSDYDLPNLMAVQRGIASGDLSALRNKFQGLVRFRAGKMGVRKCMLLMSADDAVTRIMHGQ